MSMDRRYQNALRGKEPSAAWRRRTLEAMEGAKGKKARPRRALRTAAVAAAAALVFTGGMWLSYRQAQSDPNGPGVARTPEPAVTPTPDPATWMESFSVVMEPWQMMVEDPLEGLDVPEQLPVYENPIPTREEQEALLKRLAEALGLTYTVSDWMESFGEDSQGRAPELDAECGDGCLLRLYGCSKLVIFNPPDPDAMEERLRDYLAFHVQLDSSRQPARWEYRNTTQEYFNYLGMSWVTAFTSILDRSRDAAGRLYDAAFLRYERGEDSFTLTLAPAAGDTASYPIRSQEDAVASFRSGDYWGENFTAHPDQAEILQVVLTYDTSDYQRWFQPVYRILFTQEDWDMADWMSDGVDPEPYMGVGVAYVPAIDPAYQDEVPYQRFFNDGLAHHTPEDLE